MVNLNLEKIVKKVPATVLESLRLHEGTAKVSVESVLYHPIYGKQEKRHKIMTVACEKGKDLKIGQKVFITQCKRISKTKSWKILEEEKIL
jgi:ribosomal protein S17